MIGTLQKSRFDSMVVPIGREKKSRSETENFFKIMALFNFFYLRKVAMNVFFKFNSPKSLGGIQQSHVSLDLCLWNNTMHGFLFPVQPNRETVWTLNFHALFMYTSWMHRVHILYTSCTHLCTVTHLNVFSQRLQTQV